MDSIKCTCKDWEENIKLLNAPYQLHLSVVGDYTGKKLRYCPWCGTDLKPPLKDGYGNAWKKTCPECKRDTMEILRPGKVQCSECG